jgi:hypothetical protein
MERGSAVEVGKYLSRMGETEQAVTLEDIELVDIG